MYKSGHWLKLKYVPISLLYLSGCQIDFADADSTDVLLRHDSVLEDIYSHLLHRVNQVNLLFVCGLDGVVSTLKDRNPRQKHVNKNNPKKS